MEAESVNLNFCWLITIYPAKATRVSIVLGIIKFMLVKQGSIAVKIMVYCGVGGEVYG